MPENILSNPNLFAFYSFCARTSEWMICSKTEKNDSQTYYKFFKALRVKNVPNPGWPPAKLATVLKPVEEGPFIIESYVLGISWEGRLLNTSSRETLCYILCSDPLLKIGLLGSTASTDTHFLFNFGKEMYLHILGLI